MTTIRLKYLELFFGAIIGFILVGLGAIFIAPATNYAMLKIGIVSLVFGMICIFVMTTYNYFKYHFYKGFDYGKIYKDLYLYLERGLINATVSVNGVKPEGGHIVFIPEFKIVLNDSLKTGIVYINNSIRLNDKLKSLSLSSSLPENWIVINTFLSDDNNKYIYEIERFDLKQDIFNSIDEFVCYVRHQWIYSIFIDKYHHCFLHHMLIVAQTGNGKSYLIYLLILQFLLKGHKLFICDPKNASVSRIGTEINSSYTASSTDEIICLLKEFQREMIERKKIYRSVVANKLDGSYIDAKLNAIVLIIDEYSAFRASASKYDKKTRDFIDEVIGNAIREGRQLGCYVILAQQQTNANSLPTEFKENMPIKIILGKAEQQTYITALGQIPEIARRRFLIGQGLFVCPGISTPENPSIVSVPRIDFNILDAVKVIKQL